MCKQASNDSSKSNSPAEWQFAFDSMCNEILPVKNTDNFSFKVAPGEVKTLSGFVRHAKAFHTVVTEPMDTSSSEGLLIWPELCLWDLPVLRHAFQFVCVIYLHG